MAASAESFVISGAECVVALCALGFAVVARHAGGTTLRCWAQLTVVPDDLALSPTVLNGILLDAGLSVLTLVRALDLVPTDPEFRTLETEPPPCATHVASTASGSLTRISAQTSIAEDTELGFWRKLRHRAKQGAARDPGFAKDPLKHVVRHLESIPDDDERGSRREQRATEPPFGHDEPEGTEGQDTLGAGEEERR
jgi:hypothetical protein